VKRTRQVLVIGAFALALGGVGTASASFVITNIRQISPHVRAQLKGDRGRAGARGPAGSPGQAGLPGAAGPSGVSSVTQVQGPLEIAGINSSGAAAVVLAEAQCPAGAIAVGGGFEGDTSLPSDAPIDLTTAESSSLGTGWAVILVNQTNFEPAAVHAVADCVSGAGITLAGVRAVSGSSIHQRFEQIKESVAR
jgi:hypothetical protein